MISLQNVTKVFESNGNPVHAVNDISLDVEKGEIFGVIGFSGAGKSTLIRCVNLLERPTSGKIFINNKDMTELDQAALRKTRQKIGMIFQHFNLLHSRTVFGNIAYPLKLAKFSKAEITKRVTELLQFVGLEDKASYYPDQLSGGQKQRVGIARALATSPDILLCDEATSALDPQTTDAILQLLKKVNKEYGITILMITHEMNVIREICDRVAVMENGKVIEQGTVFDVFSQPDSRTAKNFVRSVMNDHIPDSILEQLKSNQPSNIYRLIFLGESASQPLLSQVNKQFDVEANVLFGQITELQGKPFGNLIVEFKGKQEEVRKALDFVEKQILVKEVRES
ncbi:methionine ABC transporter ATP-binding protein [Bacillus seohaeanensis]|jgi:D-methionine transport system ATP-binding protein|uniref:Methionine ABC transporter ATP-binding protein n=1 Tax=Bacillus seohaeanensis TaxID=284580 RepID=A0ABW5RWN7_9BACI